MSYLLRHAMTLSNNIQLVLPSACSVTPINFVSISQTAVRLHSLKTVACTSKEMCIHNILKYLSVHQVLIREF